MKVLQINAVYKNGSTGRIVYSIEHALFNRGHECYIAYGHGTKKKNNEYLIGNIVEHKIHAILSRATGRQARFSTSATVRLLKWIDEIKPDIVHLHNMHSNYVNVVTLLQGMAERNIQTVITMHDCWFYTGGCFHYTRSGCDEWKRGCKKCGHLNYYLKPISHGIQEKNSREFRILEKKVWVTGVSQWICDEYRNSVMSSKGVYLIENFVDGTVFKPYESVAIRLKYNLNEDDFVILCPASKWFPSYNRNATEYLLKKIKKKNYQLVILGASKKQIKALENCNNVIVTGYTNDVKKLAQIYSMADVFMNLSWEDSFSLINVEAQMCGTPVVSYEACGARETVNREGLGAVCTNNDYRKLFEYVEISQMECWKESSKLIRNWVIQRYSEKVNISKYISLYERIYNSMEISEEL